MSSPFSRIRVDFRGIGPALSELDDFVVFTVEPPWSSCKGLLARPPRETVMVGEVDLETLDAYTRSVPHARHAVGLGGGRAIDAAKYFALKTGCKFISVPTILAADAYLTPKAGVRIDGVVNYIGDKFPDVIVIDQSVIGAAPKRLNRAAIGDIYSARISLMDWRRARDEVGEEYDEAVAKRTEAVLARLMSLAPEIKDVTENAIRALVEMHMELNTLQFPYLQRGKFWPQEGTEHLFFYTLEKLVGRPFVHGDVISTGAVVATYLHGEDPERTKREIGSFGVDYTAGNIKITHEEFEKTITSMKRVGREAGANYLVVEKGNPSQSQIREMWELISSQ
ncbi:MAG: iron-containing alcohol dehydrogenase [Thaumarchaeota archaeon]|nr:iron-containing alcohol dehydrogenase [Nitrososphaerota archaeon]